MATLVLPLRRRVRVFCLLLCSSVVFSLVAPGVARAQQMVASWYGPGFQGALTASGQPFNMYDYTAASPYLPFGTKLRVCYDGCVVVTVNDRGPYVAGRQLDLSYAAAQAIGLTSVGVGTVDVQEVPVSTPTGPSTSEGKASTQPSAPASSASSGASAAGPAGEASSGASGPTASSPASSQYSSAGQDRYANPARDQYANAARDQYGGEQEPGGGAPRPPASPQAAVPPPAPVPSQLEVPPPQLVKPDSTAQRAIEMGLAKAPEGYKGPVAGAEQAGLTASSSATSRPSAPASSPAPQSSRGSSSQSSWSSDAASPVGGSEQEGAGGMTVLPDTGGAPPVAFVSGTALLALGMLGAIRIFRR
ncbi:septal ring lytic transglycosylase RlpA family protein [Rubrobacter calidifluminis]|uniref:septal ring lytic transglycosylase RlpA family protein n=1 Tax=Rubrobacter calidifluminis TaxID=1392640 RepID=UPI00235EC09B|nr:septal ring lytic transglycosylase RlpA family protein [Rubrobacter calidifluminis]